MKLNRSAVSAGKVLSDSLTVAGQGASCRGPKLLLKWQSSRRTALQALGLTAAFSIVSSVHAQSSVDIYGIINLGITTGSMGNGQTVNRVDSGVGPASRLGYMGTEDLGGGLKTNFVLEQGLAVNNGTLIPGGLGYGRQAWVGLSGESWSVQAGRIYGPLDDAIYSSSAQGLAYWGSPSGALGYPDASPNATSANAGFQSPDRINNGIGGTYRIGDLKLVAVASPGDGNGRNTGTLIAFGGIYSHGPFRVDISATGYRQYAADIPSTSTPGWGNVWMAGSSYDFGPVKLFAAYYMSNPSEDHRVLKATSVTETKGGWLGVRVPIGVGALMSQVTVSHLAHPAGAAEGRALTLGAAYDYPLSKRTSLFASFGRVSNNSTSNIGLSGGSTVLAASGPGAIVTAFSLGMTHRF